MLRNREKRYISNAHRHTRAVNAINAVIIGQVVLVPQVYWLLGLKVCLKVCHHLHMRCHVDIIGLRFPLSTFPFPFALSLQFGLTGWLSTNCCLSFFSHLNSLAINCLSLFDQSPTLPTRCNISLSFCISLSSLSTRCRSASSLFLRSLRSWASFFCCRFCKMLVNVFAYDYQQWSNLPCPFSLWLLCGIVRNTVLFSPWWLSVSCRRPHLPLWSVRPVTTPTKQYCAMHHHHRQERCLLHQLQNQTQSSPL